jgi:hypothetical protein
MRIAKALLVLLVIPAMALAHDTWLVPTVFSPPAEAKFRLRIATSEAFPSSETAVRPQRVARFYLRTSADTQQITEYFQDDKFLAADVAVPLAGHAVAVFETKPFAFVLEPKIFNQYIGEEELQHVIAARAEAGKSDAPGRERYRKIAKTVLCVGDLANTPETKPTDDAYSRPDGLWLEIIPESSPCAAKLNGSLTFRVLFQGKPLAGAKLAAGYEGPTGHHYPIWLTTDVQGRATVKFDRVGAWYVRTLHMIPTANDAESDWESAFSTVTFEVRR